MALAAITAVSAIGDAPSLAAQPNIVLIISDDHDNAHLGFMGNSFAHTPTLDELARQGTVFTTAHLPMSRCHPTLASFLSGREPHQTGVYYNFGEKTLDPTNSLPNILKQAGYATLVQGKYWEQAPREMGFTHGEKTSQAFVRQGQDAVISFLDEVGGRQPFFIWWAPRIPHTPHNPPEKYQRLLGNDMPVPPFVRRADKQRFEEWQEKERLSYAMEAWLDDGVNDLLGHLKRRSLLDNTMFVFVIDNGWCNGRASKGSAFEKGVQTPIFVTWPGTVPGEQRRNCLISTHDIYPTILDYAEIPVPETAVGRSLRPLIDGDLSGVRQELFGAIYPAFATENDNRPERDVYALYARNDRWKYIYYLQDVRQERNQEYFRIQSIATDFPTRKRGDEDFFDLQSDPYEEHDLSDALEHRQQMDQMRARLMAWWKETGGQPLDLP